MRFRVSVDYVIIGEHPNKSSPARTLLHNGLCAAKRARINCIIVWHRVLLLLLLLRGEGEAAGGEGARG